MKNPATWKALMLTGYLLQGVALGGVLMFWLGGGF